MTTLYLSALAAVALTFMGLLLDTLVRVRRRFEWPAVQRPRFVVVQTLDRRQRSVPWVGAERRGVPTALDFALAYGEVRRGA